MRTAPCYRPFGPLFLVALLACTSTGRAQTGAPSAKLPVAVDAAPPQPGKVAPNANQPGAAKLGAAQPATALSASAQPVSSANQLIERIHVEGGATQIEELRVGGETRSITVQPKGGLPAYDVQPTTGTRAWKVLGF